MFPLISNVTVCQLRKSGLLNVIYPGLSRILKFLSNKLCFRNNEEVNSIIHILHDSIYLLTEPEGMKKGGRIMRTYFVHFCIVVCLVGLLSPLAANGQGLGGLGGLLQDKNTSKKGGRGGWIWRNAGDAFRRLRDNVGDCDTGIPAEKLVCQLQRIAFRAKRNLNFKLDKNSRQSIV